MRALPIAAAILMLAACADVREQRGADGRAALSVRYSDRAAMLVLPQGQAGRYSQAQDALAGRAEALCPRGYDKTESTGQDGAWPVLTWQVTCR